MSTPPSSSQHTRLLQRLRGDPNWKWLKPGIGVKRWLLLSMLGVTFLALALAFVLVDIYRGADLPGVTYYLTLQLYGKLL